MRRHRAWFCMRCGPRVKDPKTSVSFFLSITYAQKTALGLDEIMTRVEGKYWLYEIRRGKKTYRVLEVLADYGADVLTGRGTRVYKVQPVTETGELEDICVLEDVWMNDDRKPEHETYDDILKTLKDDKDRDFLTKHLLTPSESWMVHVNGEEDHTIKMMMHGISTETSKFFILVSKEEGDYDAESESAAPLMSFDEEPDEKVHLATRGPPNSISKVANRQHCHIVFKQVAPSISQLASLSEVFHVLSDSAKVLKILAKYEWVHRDISAGNVYHHDRKGLLGDLECAKIMGEGGGHEVLTGTLDFMAAEVLGQRYKVPLELDSVIEENVDFRKNIEVTENPPFQYNPGHDVESFFWLALFMLFFYRDISSPEETEENKKKRRECRKYVFPEDILQSEINRYAIIFIDRNFADRVGWLCDSFKVLVNPLLNFSRTSCGAYVKFERTMRVKKDTTIFRYAHHIAINVFDFCAGETKNIKIESRKHRTGGDCLRLTAAT